MIFRSACASSATSASAAATRRSTRDPLRCAWRAPASTPSRSRRAENSKTRATSKANRSIRTPATRAIAACLRTHIPTARTSTSPKPSRARCATRGSRLRSSPSEKSDDAISRKKSSRKGRAISSAWRARSSPIRTFRRSGKRTAKTPSCDAFTETCARRSTRISNASCARCGRRSSDARRRATTRSRPNGPRRAARHSPRNRTTAASSFDGTPRRTTKACTATSSCAQNRPRKPPESCCIMQAFARARCATKTCASCRA